MMDEEGSIIAREALFETISNQIRDNNPPLVKLTLNRLMSEGHSRHEAMKLIGCALSVELFEIMKNNEPFNAKRYDENLGNLPQLPWDE